MGSDIPSNEGQQEQQVETPQEEALHPSWQKAMEGIPEDLRDSEMFKGLVSNIRESEKNARKAIEDARGQAPQIDESWAQLMQEAGEAGITPQDFADGYMASTTMREQIAEDPEGFLDSLQSALEEAVERGDITVAEGSRLLKKAEKQADALDLAAPDPRVEQLEKRINARERAEQAQEQARAEEQELAQAKAEADAQGVAFVTTAEQVFAENGFAEIPKQSKGAIANYAANLLESGAANDVQSAMQASIDLFKEQFGLTAPAGGAPAATRPPIGGGSSALQTQAPQKFATEKDRDAAMIALAQQMAAAGD